MTVSSPDLALEDVEALEDIEADALSGQEAEDAIAEKIMSAIDAVEERLNEIEAGLHGAERG